MGYDRHLFRRGTVWQWRRRICGLSTGSCILQVSLRTTDRREAVKLARMMSVECDRMLDDNDPKSLSQADLNTWMREVFADALDKQSRARTVGKMDAGADTAEEALWDQATARAWGLLDDHGLSARVPANVDPAKPALTEMEEHVTGAMLASLAKTLRSEGLINKNAASFQRATGRPATSAFHLIQLQQAYIKAMAHAFRALPDLHAGRDDAEKSMLDDTLADILATEAKIFSARGNMANEHSSESAMATVPVVQTVMTAVSTAEFSIEKQCPPADPSLSAVADRLISDKRSQDLREATAVQYGSCAALFTKITGITDVRAIDQDALKAFKEGLSRIPTNYGKSPSDKDLSYAQILAKADPLPDDKVGLSPTTKNRHLDHVKQFLEKAVEDGIVLPHKVNTTKLRVKEKKRDRDKRAAFRRPELETLFKHTLWTGHRRKDRRHEPGSVLVKDGTYWVPLIGSVTGARLEEIAALTVKDIGEEDGIHFFTFDVNEIRDVKTEASRRRVPIHPALIADGLLGHVELMRRAKSVALFPEMAPGKGAKSKYGKKLGYAWRRALEIALDDNPRDLCFHSMRHFVNNQIRDMKDVPKLVRLNILGQEAEDTNDRTYSEDSKLSVMLEVITRLPTCWQHKEELLEVA